MATRPCICVFVFVYCVFGMSELFCMLWLVGLVHLCICICLFVYLACLSESVCYGY